MHAIAFISHHSYTQQANRQTDGLRADENGMPLGRICVSDCLLAAVDVDMSCGHIHRYVSSVQYEDSKIQEQSHI